MNVRRFRKIYCVLAGLFLLFACETPSSPAVEEEEEPGILETEIIASTLTPASGTGCGSGTEIAPEDRPFAVEPQTFDPAEVGALCANLPAGTDWARMQGENAAGWGYGLATILDFAARVYFPGGSSDVLMAVDTEIRLPAEGETVLELLAGELTVNWEKAGSTITAIQAGTENYDPDLAIFDLTYDPDTQTSNVRVYGGEIIVLSELTGVAWQIPAWQGAVFRGQVATLASLAGEAPEPIVGLLVAQDLNVASPWGQEIPRELDAAPVLDPVLAADTASRQILGLLMEGLAKFDANGSLVPAGAVAWEVNDDGTVFTFFLREAFWSDGVMVVAEHYRDGICRAGQLDPEVAQSTTLEFIAGYAEYVARGGQDCSVVGIEIIDDLTLQIVTSQPFGDLGNLMTTPFTYPVRVDVLEECGEAAWVEPGCFVSNGPYVLTGRDDQILILEKNQGYWNAEEVELEGYEFTFP